jgi:hypothetical protein
MILKNKIIGGFLLMLLIFLFTCPATTLAQSSENFKLIRSVVDQGGTASQSSLFKVNDAIGQPVGGEEMLSSLYQVSGGFFPFEFTTPAPIFPDVADSQTIGDEFWVDIVVGSNEEPVSDLFGISFILNFSNTNFVDVVTPHSSNAIPGDFIGNDVVFFQTVEEENGKVSVGISRKSGQVGVSGSGVVARVKFLSDASTPDDTEVLFSLTDVVANNSVMSPITLSQEELTVTISRSTEVKLDRFDIPNSYILSQNYPNPFNPETIIEYQLPENVHVKIDIFNLRGQNIRSLKDQPQHAGYHTIRWDGCDENGTKVVSGIYLYQVKAGDFICTRKMALMK